MNPKAASRRDPFPVTPENVAGEPAPHTAHEIRALLTLLGVPADGPSRPRSVAVGHSRDRWSREAAAAFAQAWEGSGGTIATLVDWPEEAASWLRQARRFTADAPDAWVVAATPAGWVRMAGRLWQSTGWDPARTYGFASLGTPDTAAADADGILDGMRGVRADGAMWEIRGRRLWTVPAGAPRAIR